YDKVVTIHRNILNDLPCLSIQANSHLVNSALFCQQSYQLTNPIFKFVNPVSNPPLLDIFPQSKNP
ncbi:TPA: hypothetical protein ACGOXX_001574, partial [Streptococcus suis]